MPITSIKEALKALIQSLQISTIIPSLLIISINIFYIFPNIWPNSDWSFTNYSLNIMFAIITIMFSNLYYAFNFTIIRILEGYFGWDSPILKPLKQIKVLEKKKLYNNLLRQKAYYMNSIIGKNAVQYLDTYFPNNKDSILPTRLGNAIKAFEDYPSLRYGIDSVALWPRLAPILVENKYIEFVSQQKSSFDFLINLMIATIICSFELVYLCIYLNKILFCIFILIASFLSIKFLYFGIINGAVQWGFSVRVAFDLYRKDLWTLLRLKSVNTFSDEINRWKEISNLISSGNSKNNFDSIDYKKEK